MVVCLRSFLGNNFIHKLPLSYFLTSVLEICHLKHVDKYQWKTHLFQSLKYISYSSGYVKCCSCCICRWDKISCAQKDGKHVIIFWHSIRNGGNNFVTVCGVDCQLNHCTCCVFLRSCNADEISMQSGSLSGLTALQEHSALTESCDMWLIIESWRAL